MPEQAAQFRDGEREQVGRQVGRELAPDGDLAQRGEVGMGQHGEREVAMPAGPRADLVLVEADLALGSLEAGLDRPARAGDLDQVAEGGAV